LRIRWEAFFDFLDVNHDRVVSIDDAEKPRNDVINFYARAGSQSAGVVGDLEKWWNTCVLQNGPVGRRDFLYRLEYEYHQSKKHFIQNNLKCFVELFLIFDINKDGLLSLDEYIKVFNAFDYKHYVLIRVVFNAHAPKPSDFVSINAVINIWMQLTTEENVRRYHNGGDDGTCSRFFCSFYRLYYFVGYYCSHLYICK
jgi:hypothetical protein